MGDDGDHLQRLVLICCSISVLMVVIGKDSSILF